MYVCIVQYVYMCVCMYDVLFVCMYVCMYLLQFLNYRLQLLYEFCKKTAALRLILGGSISLSSLINNVEFLVKEL